ncbi:MAG: hypothetical protein ACFFBD_03720, partial [Candidatus Hodarchaeota archaeon]
KIFFALLTRQPVIFIGDKKYAVEQALSTLLTFYPCPSVCIWADTPINDCLLIGTHSKNLDYYDKEPALIVDLRTYKVKRGEKNEFCAQLIAETIRIGQKSSLLDAKIYFQSKISSLFVIFRALLEISAIEKEKQPQEFQNLLANYPKANIHLILRMSNNLNSILGKKIQIYLNF